MTTPPASGSGSDDSSPSGSGDQPEAPFDPYRFGHPDVPPTPEYAPPGYRPPTPTAPLPATDPSTSPAPGGSYPYGPPQYGQPPYGQPPYGQSPYGQPYGQAPAPYGQSPYGPPQYGQAPFGQPPYQPNPYGGPPQFAPQGGNGKATAGLVLGIISILLFWTTILDAIFIIVGLVFAILGLNESKRGRSGRGSAIAGIICAALGAVLAIGFTVFAVHLSNECGGSNNPDNTAYHHCIREKL